MDVRVTRQAATELACDVLVIGVGYNKEQKTILLPPIATSVDKALKDLISESYASGEFGGKPGEMLTIHPMQQLTAKRVIVMGLGAQGKISTQTLRRASAIATRHAQNTGARHIALALELTNASDDENGQAVSAEVE